VNADPTRLPAPAALVIPDLQAGKARSAPAGCLFLYANQSGVQLTAIPIQAQTAGFAGWETKKAKGLAFARQSGDQRMRLFRRALPFVVILLMSAAGPAEAAVQVFLCADPDIVGDSKDAEHVGCSDALSVAQQVAVNPQPPPAVPNCREALQPIVVVKPIDSASAPYLLHVLQQRRLRAVDILVRRTGAEPGPDFLRMSLLDTVVIGVSQNAASVADPIESISFLPTIIEWSFTPQRPDGSPGTPVQARLACR
jgi:type VI protein secretion system component Hcp